nr:MAG TPA: hypothetical protein [Caudoviricetes sp.]DAR13324.1 MAG TPA: hypothetical protein [Caudoviricetes sp.]
MLLKPPAATMARMTSTTSRVISRASILLFNTY